ncbi:hypothetical protein B484DRAFT_202514 [Ochromonadaceae sp. CCMP2298]|nr:hypothetical protein B484DRAFT_202514 [Ochromonadaceae sp. CCMP2298]
MQSSFPSRGSFTSLSGDEIGSSMRKFNLSNALKVTPSQPKGQVGLPWYFTFLFRLSWKSVVVSIFAVFSTYFSYRYGLLINLRGNNLVSIAVVFPIVFSINAAYQRREEALRALATIKGNMFAVRLCYAHWYVEGRAHPC